MKKINISPREKYKKNIFKHDVSSFSIFLLLSKLKIKTRKMNRKKSTV